MSSFEERKEAYLEKLSTNMDFVKSLLEKNDEQSRKTAKMLLMPSNENEIRLADGTLTVMGDLKRLAEAAICDNVDKIPVEENAGIQMIVGTVKTLLESSKSNAPVDIKETLEKKFGSMNNGKELAKATYQLMVGILTDPEETFTYIQDQIGIDFDDEVEVAKTQLYLQETQAAMQSATPSTSKDPSELTEESLASFEEYVQELHTLCDNGIHKEDSLDSIAKIFLKMLLNESDDDE